MAYPQFTSSRRLRRLIVCWAGACLWQAVAILPVQAHRAPQLLALWGGWFDDARAVQCQRALGHAAAICASRSWTARDHCLGALLAGDHCDAGALQTQLSNTHALARTLVGRYCRSDTVVTLHFSSITEAYADVDIVCKQIEDAAASAVYGPAMDRGMIVPVDAATSACIAATSIVTTSMLRYGFRSHRSALDRVASKDLGVSIKQALVQASLTHINRRRATLQRHLLAKCGSDSFIAAYGRPVAAFLRLVAQRADCLAGATYVQDALVCPLATCGNGMKEPPEDCDDGNRADGDGCRGDCTSEN